MQAPKSSQSPGYGVASLALSGAGVVVASGLTAALGFGSAYPYVLVVTLLNVAVIGGPAFSLIRDRPNWKTISIAGFATGASFPALVGIVGLERPLDYLFLVGGFGFAGTGGAMIAWLLVKWLLAHGPVAKACVASLVAAGVAAMWVVPWALMDRSCHNTLRDGRSSISPIAGFSLEANMSEWREVQTELSVFARENSWEVQADVRPDPGFPWFQVSLCREPGTHFFVHKAAFEEGRISISVFQPQGGDSWQAPMKELQDRLERRWPGRTGYDIHSPRPPWAPPVAEPTNAPLRPRENSL